MTPLSRRGASLRLATALVALGLAACGSDGTPVVDAASPDTTAGTTPAPATPSSEAAPGAPAPGPSPAPSPAAPTAPSVTASTGTGGAGFSVRDLSWTGATGASRFEVALKGVRGGSPFTLPLRGDVTAAPVSFRIPAWWDAADTLLTTACNTIGCTAESGNGQTVGTVPSPVDLGPAPGSNVNLGVTNGLALSADGRTLVAAPGSAGPSTPLRLFTRASATAAWSGADLARTAGAASLASDWGYALAGDGALLVIGDGSFSPGGRIELIVAPGTGSQRTVTIAGASGETLGLAPTLSADGTRLAVIARDAAAAARIRVYDVSGVAASGWTPPAPVTVPVPVGMTIDSGTRVALNADGTALAIAGRASSGDSAVYAIVDLDGSTTSTAIPFALRGALSGPLFVGSWLALSADGTTLALAATLHEFFGSANRLDVFPPLACTTSAPRTCTAPGTALVSRSAGGFGVLAFAMSPDGRVLAFGESGTNMGDGRLTIWIRTGSGWAQSRQYAGTGTEGLGASVAISRDLSIAAGVPFAGGSEGRVRFY